MFDVIQLLNFRSEFLQMLFNNFIIIKSKSIKKKHCSFYNLFEQKSIPFLHPPLQLHKFKVYVTNKIFFNLLASNKIKLIRN